jgi:hypothetical protein
MPPSRLSLPPDLSPNGHAWEHRDDDSVILPSAFNSCINQRDKFLGQKRCIICGLVSDMVLQRYHIIESWETVS